MATSATSPTGPRSPRRAFVVPERVLIAMVSISLMSAGLLLLALLPGCGESGDRAPTARAGDLGPPSATYTTRGLVEALPGPGSEFTVKHEPIQTFVDKDGRVVGMGTMSMPFPIGESVGLEDVAVGDKVEVTFDVWWTPTISYRATRVVELPAETELVFGPAAPASGEGKPNPGATHEHSGHEAGGHGTPAGG